MILLLISIIMQKFRGSFGFSRVRTRVAGSQSAVAGEEDGDSGDGRGTGNGASAAAATAAYGSTAASGQDFTVADYDRLKFERRQALDFCSAHFAAFVNIQKCIYELYKNARY